MGSNETNLTKELYKLHVKPTIIFTYPISGMVKPGILRITAQGDVKRSERSLKRSISRSSSRSGIHGGS